MTLAIVGATLGFLQYNFNPATIFMGDTGSMFLGYCLASVSMAGSIKSLTAITIMVPILALGVPIFDTTCTIIRRFKNGKPIFTPDKGHLHHKLLQKGLTMKQAVLVMYGISIILCTFAILFIKYTYDINLIILFVLTINIVLNVKIILLLKKTNNFDK